jgi:hypothetical protein
MYARSRSDAPLVRWRACSIAWNASLAASSVIGALMFGPSANAMPQ